MSLKSALFEPTQAVKRAAALLTLRERWVLALACLMRIFVTALDLGGIVLVGVVVSIVSGTRIGAESLVGQILQILANLGFANGYVVFAVVAIGFFLAKGIVSIWLSFLTSQYLAAIESRRSTDLYRGVLTKDLGSLDGLARNEILYGLTHSTNVIFSQTLSIATSLVGEFALLLAVSIYLASTNLVLFLVISLFFGVVGAGMQYFLGTRASRIGAEAQENLMRAQATAMGSLENLRQLRVFGIPETFVQRFSRDRTSLAHQNALNSILVALPRYITEIAVMLGVGFLILLRSNDSGVSVGAPTIAVFLVGIFRIVASMLPIQSGLTALGKNRAETVLAYEMLSRAAGSSARPSQEPSRVSASFISVQDVGFHYPSSNEQLYSGLCLEVMKGEFIAITGRSGSGKSTLADLLLGLRMPTSGRISIAGLPLSDFIEANPGKLGYVPQKINLLDSTLRENLLLGRHGTKQLSDQALTDVLVSLGLESLLQTLPQGLDTRLGENGVELSGGQVQRVGLARALVSRPIVLILDESTSALDSETSALVTGLIEKLKGEITLIVVAHHPETIKAADKVFVLRQGKLFMR